MTDAPTYRTVKMPKGQPHAGMYARVLDVRETEIDLHIFRQCRTTMRGHVSKRLTLSRDLFPELTEA